MSLETIQFFLGNLPFHATEAETRAFIESRALVRVADVRFMLDGGASRGCGFATIHVDRTLPETDAAMLALDGAEFEGRVIRVELSRRERERRARLQQHRGAAA